MSNDNPMRDHDERMDFSLERDAVRDAFEEAGFWLERFMGCWMKTERGYTVTVADGMGLNEMEYEVQIATDDGSLTLACSEGGQTPASAIAFAAEALAHLPTRAPHVAPDKLALFPEVVTALRAAVCAAQPLPAPLGPPLTAHVDLWPQWVVDARAVLAKVDA